MRSEIIEKMSMLIASAFGLVAALSWNSAIQAVFSTYYKQPGEGVTSQIIYAVTVTVIAILVTLWISRAAEKAKKREDLLTRHVDRLRENISKLKK